VAERQRQQVRGSAGEWVHEGRRQVTAGGGQRPAVVGGEEEGAAARGGELDLREAAVGEGPGTAADDDAVVLGGQEKQRGGAPRARWKPSAMTGTPSGSARGRRPR
jgi:hypothetical protein